MNIHKKIPPGLIEYLYLPVTSVPYLSMFFKWGDARDYLQTVTTFMKNTLPLTNLQKKKTQG
jgi:hypothetical protein